MVAGTFSARPTSQASSLPPESRASSTRNSNIVVRSGDVEPQAVEQAARSDQHGIFRQIVKADPFDKFGRCLGYGCLFGHVGENIPGDGHQT